MSHPSPLQHLHASADPLIGHYGTPEAAISVVQAFDPIEVEYAAIRRHAAVFDLPHAGALEFRGPDRVAFLNRMLTQNLADLPVGRSRNSFLLDRKGRIAADLRIVNLIDRTLALGEVFAIERARESLEKYIISEDVTIADLTGTHHQVALHGPAAAAIVAAQVSGTGASGADVSAIVLGAAVETSVGGAAVVVDRHDWCGEIGLTLLVESTRAVSVYETLSTSWSARGQRDIAAPQTELARRIGWHALNIARIEAGTPVYMLDFGPNSLPHETGDETLNDRVSFKKGCYLGQEIIARMQSLGHPKQKLVGLRIEVGIAESTQPETGTPVLDSDQPGAVVVGAITSSAFSPMNSGAPVCFAMVKFSHAVAGKALFLQTETGLLAAVVQPTLSFLQRAV